MNSYDTGVKLYEAQLREWMSKCPSCQLSPQVSLHARKGTAMVQVGQSFEFDERLRDRNSPPNRFITNLLLPYNGKVKNPIILWLNSSFPRDCAYELHKDPVTHHVLRLGGGYTLTSLQAGLKTALKAEKIDVDGLSAWNPKNWKY